MIRKPLVALLPLLLTACTGTATPSYSTVDDDPFAAATCYQALRAADEMVTEEGPATIHTSLSAAGRALRSADPEIKAAGERLVPIAKRAGDMDVYERASAAEMAPVRQELGVAQQDLLAACDDRFGPRPWAFLQEPAFLEKPAPAASS